MFEEQRYVYQYGYSNFIAQVYSWMCVALAVTAATAWYVASTPAFAHRIIEQPWLLIVIFIAQLGLVIALSALLEKINLVSAIVLFLVYAVSLGVTTSLILSMYTLASIGSTFLITSGMFGGMALYGYFTKTDLTKVQNVSIMILWGMILSMLVNLFLKSVWFDYVVSMVGVVIFALLTAADTQKLKTFGQRFLADEQTQGKAAILGALMLYLDFINLFLFLLRFTGNRREQ
jgi:FtsH-binding integral membrane protein